MKQLLNRLFVMIMMISSMNYVDANHNSYRSPAFQLKQPSNSQKSSKYVALNITSEVGATDGQVSQSYDFTTIDNNQPLMTPAYYSPHSYQNYGKSFDYQQPTFNFENDYNYDSTQTLKTDAQSIIEKNPQKNILDHKNNYQKVMSELKKKNTLTSPETAPTNPQNNQIPGNDGFDIKIETPYLDAITGAANTLSNRAQSLYKQAVSSVFTKPQDSDQVSQTLQDAVESPTSYFNDKPAKIPTNPLERAGNAAVNAILADPTVQTGIKTVNAVADMTTAAAKNAATAALQAATPYAIVGAKAVGQSALNAAGMGHIDINQHPVALAGKITSHYAEGPVDPTAQINPSEKSYAEIFSENITPGARKALNNQINSMAQTGATAAGQSALNAAGFNINLKSEIEQYQADPHKYAASLRKSAINSLTAETPTAQQSETQEPSFTSTLLTLDKEDQEKLIDAGKKGAINTSTIAAEGIKNYLSTNNEDQTSADPILTPGENAILNKNVNTIYSALADTAQKTLSGTGKNSENIEPAQNIQQSIFSPNKENKTKFNKISEQAKNRVVDMTNKALIDHFNPENTTLPDNIAAFKTEHGTTIEEVLPPKVASESKKQASVQLQRHPKKQPTSQEPSLSKIIDVPTRDLFDQAARLDIRDGVLTSVYLGKSLVATPATLNQATGLYTAEIKYSDATIDIDPLRVKNKFNQAAIKTIADALGLKDFDPKIAVQAMNVVKPVEDNTLTVTFDPKTKIFTQKLTKPNVSGGKIETTTTYSVDSEDDSAVNPKQVATMSQQVSRLFLGTGRYLAKTPEGVKSLISQVSSYLAKKFKLSQSDAIVAKEEMSQASDPMAKDMANAKNSTDFNNKLKNWMSRISEQYINFVDRINSVKNPSKASLSTKTMVITEPAGDRFFPKITISSDPQTNTLQFATFEKNGRTYKLTPGNPDKDGSVILSAEIEYKPLTAMEQVGANLKSLAREKIVTTPILNGVMISNATHAYPELVNSILDWYYGPDIVGYDGIEIKYDRQKKAIEVTINQIVTNGKPDASGSYHVGTIPKTIIYPMG